VRVSPAATNTSGGRLWRQLRNPFGPDRDEERDQASPQQHDVDEYLAYLDKRYHRLHDEDDKAEIKFSALNWLHHGNSKHSDSEVEHPSSSLSRSTQEESDNALYVLGVAGLASQRLLQKKSLPPTPAASTGTMDHQHEVAVATISARTIMDAEVFGTSGSKVAPAIALVAARIGPVFRRLSVQRKLFLRYQSRQLVAIATSLARTIAALPAKAGKAVWKYGGGKRNVAVTATLVASLLFFIIRPLAQAVVSEGSRTLVSR